VVCNLAGRVGSNSAFHVLMRPLPAVQTAWHTLRCGLIAQQLVNQG